MNSYNGIYNPYSQYNTSINQTNMLPVRSQSSSALNNNNTLNAAPLTQPYIPSNSQIDPISSNGNRIILSNTYLPRSYYDDIIDNLELVSLNMINDLKVLINNQKNVRVSKFDTNQLLNLKDAVKEQFIDVKDFREKQKNKILEEFSKSKEMIENYVNDRFKPAHQILDNFTEELKKDKNKFNKKLIECEESLFEEDSCIRDLLLASTDYLVKTAAQKVYRPDAPSDLENALKYKNLYGNEDDKKEVEIALEKAKKSPVKIMIDNSPDEIEEMLERQKELDDLIKKDRLRLLGTEEELKTGDDGRKLVDFDEKEYGDACQSELELTDDDEDELVDNAQEEMDVYMNEQLKKAKILMERKKKARRFKILATAIFAAQKLQVIKDSKKISRIKEFNKKELSVEEYLENFLDEILAKPIENISQFKSKLDITMKSDMDKLEEFLKSITDNLIIKTTKIKINRTVSLFFKRSVFVMDVVQKNFFSFFEKNRILYLKGEELTHEQKSFVLIMKIIVGILVYEILLREAEDDNEVIGFNFKLIASVFYFNIITTYCSRLPKHRRPFDNTTSDEEIIALYMPAKGIEDSSYKKVLMNYMDYKRKMNLEIMEDREKNEKDNVGYNPDTNPDEVEEILNILLPFEEVRLYLETKTNYDLMEQLEIWSNNTINIIESHNEAYLQD